MLRESPQIADKEPSAAEQREAAIVAAVVALEQQGRCTPETVLEAARDPRSPLHAVFTWDDAEAAEKHRLEEARALIRRVRIIVEYSDEKLVIPRYLRDAEQDTDEQGYVSVPRLQRSPKQARAVLDYERTRVVGLLERLRGIAKGLGDKSLVATTGKCIALLKF